MNSSAFVDCAHCEQGSAKECVPCDSFGWVAEALEALREQMRKFESMVEWEDVFREAA